MSVHSSQRFTRHQPCPICAGFDDAPRSKGVRCFGFLSDDGGYAHCSREEFAGGLRFSENSQTFAHKLEGDCKCGSRHDPSLAAVSVKKKVEATYRYTDEHGKLLFEVVRFKPKDFRQRRPDGNGGWVWNLRGVRRVLYRLPEVVKAEQVFVVEGERDADMLASWGVAATTNPAGAGQWKPEYSEFLRGKRVVIIPDADEAGRRHGLDVASSLLGVAAEVRIVELPGAKDVSEWAEHDGSRELLIELAQSTEPTTKESLKALRAQWLPAQDATTETKTGKSTPPDAAKIILTLAADIKPVPIHWLWPGRIARGKLSLLVGHPGVGKSQLALVLAATVSQGWNWPDGSSCLRGHSLVLSAEDDPADTILPRLMANGANLGRVHVLAGVREGFTPEGREVRRELCLADDIDKLSAALEKIPDVALVVIDPIAAYLGELDSHRDASVRGLLAPLAALAAERRVAVLAIAHLNKNAHADALSRVTGSLAFVAAARSAWLVGKDPHDTARRLFVPLKNNLGADGTGLAFEIQPTTARTEAGELPTTSLLWFDGEITTTAAEILAAGGSAHERGEALTEAEAFLAALLAEGPVSSEKIRRQSNAAGLSWAAVRRAKEALKISVRKCGLAGGWEWSLPAKALKFPEDAQATGVSPFEEVEPLRRGGQPPKGESWPTSSSSDTAMRPRELPSDAPGRPAREWKETDL